jgi:hypothetical protein
MKITPKQFNSLKQLDRIEYRQKQDRIEGSFSGFLDLTYYLMKYSLIFLVGGVVLTSSMFGFQAAQLAFIKLLNYSDIVGALILLSFIYDIYKSILKKKVLNALDEEYFKVEVKNAKRRK